MYMSESTLRSRDDNVILSSVSVMCLITPTKLFINTCDFICIVKQKENRIGRGESMEKKPPLHHAFVLDGRIV